MNPTAVFIEELDRMFHELVGKGWRGARAEDAAIEAAYEAAKVWQRDNTAQLELPMGTPGA